MGPFWGQIMQEFRIEAVYQQGKLVLPRALPLQDGQKVSITIRATGTAAERFSGSVPWTGDPDELTDFLANHDESQWGNRDVWVECPRQS
jgi:predicted DNA-binding antitoxin AbrB/MazE fold protein